ncbi:MAG: class I SAM-dependent RNA methyltransferase [Thermoanaerobaculia bacterium]|nr:class I SAM-dependent RNA methyltransferase [Thermoanaerobaculia bacterium]MBP9824678.1 class I SAM-dependent RNA methyltransferase [Thermoanaerobaculia bacterium]
MTYERPTAGLRLSELEELELSIEKLVAGGDGLGRFEGIPIFVPRSAPGDRVRVRLFERKPDYGRAEILELLTPGPGRRQAPCPYFDRCGGCDLQHLEEAVQLRHKSAALLETVRRISGVAVPEPSAVVAGQAWGYRLRTQLHTRAVHGGYEVGYFARRSRDLVGVATCAVLVPQLEGELATLARRLPERAPSRIDLASGDGALVSYSPLVEGLPHGELRRRIGSFEYRFDARCFFQGHAGLLEQLVEVVVGSATGETAADLYGGVGLFALPLARRYSRVLMVEGDRIATRFARKNARANFPDLPEDLSGERGLEIVGQAVETWVGGGLAENLDRIVVDPPRDGLSAAVRRLLVSRPPRRLTYVSCHPAALGRDLRELSEVMAIESLVLLDLFPQTGHMEAVLQLTRR